MGGEDCLPEEMETFYYQIPFVEQVLEWG